MFDLDAGYRKSRGGNTFTLSNIVSDNGLAMDGIRAWFCIIYHTKYLQTSNISRKKYQNIFVSRIVLQLSSLNLLKPGVKSIMKMQLEQGRQAILQLHLSDQNVIAY